MSFDRKRLSSTFTKVDLAADVTIVSVSGALNPTPTTFLVVNHEGNGRVLCKKGSAGSI